MKAAEYGHVECVKVLAPLEKEMKNNYGWTALMDAALSGHLECVKFLTSNEAGMRGNSGQTAMMKSAHDDKTTSVLSPFEAGITDNKGWNQTC